MQLAAGEDKWRDGQHAVAGAQRGASSLVAADDLQRSF